MQQPATNTQLPATIPALNLNAETIRQTFATIKDKQTRACAAMSQIKAITSDAEDKAANDLLVKVRLTLDGKEGIKGITEMVRDITKEIDAVRGALLEPKKAIETEADRIKQLRNAYATDKLKAQQLEADRIAKEKAQNDEIARIKAAMRENVTNGIVNIVTEMNESIRAFVGKMTLENWDSQAAKLNVTPKLKMDKYISLFHVECNPDYISKEMYLAITEEIRQELPYDKVNAQYVESATGVLKMWIDDLPKIKERLEFQAKSMKERGPIAGVQAAQTVASEVENKAATAVQTIQQQQATAAAEIARQHDQDRLNNEVAAVVQQQATTAPKGIRKGRVAIIANDAFYLEHTITQLVKACLSHPKFTGHLKRDRKGTLAGPDKNGNPVYADWLSELLTFAAKEIDADIPGITWKETVTTIAK